MRLTGLGLGGGATARLVVAIPARNERERIGACLHALAGDGSAHGLVVVLFSNNSTDGTADAAREAAARLGCELAVVDAHLPPGRAHAGEARRLAMRSALDRCGQADILATTDADGRVEPGWRSGIHRAIEDGADVVCGRAIIDPDEALAVPAHLHADDRRETEYAALLDRIASVLDPDPADPWPRHGEESGASIAVRPALFRLVGGVPEVELGEDRALVRRLRLAGARIRHDDAIRVVVSGRLEGRAGGGMADTMRRRMLRQDEHVDDRLEPVSERLRRIRLRLLFRELSDTPSITPSARDARRSGTTITRLASCLRLDGFEQGWDAMERFSTFLPRRTPIRYEGELDQAIGRAKQLLAILDRRRAASLLTHPPPTGDRADTRELAPRNVA